MKSDYNLISDNDYSKISFVTKLSMNTTLCI